MKQQTTRLMDKSLGTFKGLLQINSCRLKTIKKTDSSLPVVTINPEGQGSFFLILRTLPFSDICICAVQDRIDSHHAAKYFLRGCCLLLSVMSIMMSAVSAVMSAASVSPDRMKRATTAFGSVVRLCGRMTAIL